jgi:hypothetical protein
MQTDAEAHELLVVKLRRGTPYGIAAVIRRVSTSDQQDGYSWWLLISDGSKARELEVTMSATTFDRIGANRMDRSTLEGAVERMAGRYAVANRLADLLSGSVTLNPDDFAGASGTIDCMKGTYVRSLLWARADDVAKRRRQGLVVCRAARTFKGLFHTRPGVTLAPTFTAWVACQSRTLCA